MHPPSLWCCRQPWPASPRRNRRNNRRVAGSPPSRRPPPDRLLDGEFADFAGLPPIHVRGAAGEGALEIAERIAAQRLMPSLDLISSHRRSASAPVPDSWTLPCASFSTVWARLTESGVPVRVMDS